MKKLKDFIYDKNDIIIALLILVIAALIIFWRLNIILEYPKQLVGNGDTGVSDNVDDGDDDALDDNSDNDDGNTTDDDTGDDNQTGTDTPSDTSVWSGGMLTQDIEVEVTGNSASAAIQCLIDKGLFDDYADYQSVCEDAGLDHEKVKAGTFTFEKGSTKKDIAKMMNWG